MKNLIILVFYLLLIFFFACSNPSNSSNKNSITHYTPANNSSVLVNQPIHFTWSKVSYAVSYWLTISSDSIIGGSGQYNTLDTSYTFTITNNTHSAYWWRVAVINYDSTYFYSDEYKFYVH